MWARLLSAALGIWLMAAPAVLGYGRPMSVSDRVAGPLLAAFSIVAIWGVMRSLRWWTLPVGLWLLLAPWLLGGPVAAYLDSMLVGVAAIALCFVRGAVTDQYGGGWASLLHPRGRTLP